MTHIKYPNELAPPVYNNLGQRIDQLTNPSCQEEAMRQSNMLYVSLTRAANRAANAEAKLAEALELLKKAQTYITDLEEHEGAEGFSDSTKVLSRTYYAALYASLAELEKTE